MAGVGPAQVAGPSCFPGVPGTSGLKMLHSCSAPFQEKEARSQGYDHVARVYSLPAHCWLSMQLMFTAKREEEVFVACTDTSML